MSIHLNGADIVGVLHVVRIVGSIVSIVVIGLLIAWAIRPSRRNRDRGDRGDRREAIENDAAENDAMWRLLDRMEDRLEVLERALADQVETPRVRGSRHEEIFAPADEGRDSGRTE